MRHGVPNELSPCYRARPVLAQSARVVIGFGVVVAVTLHTVATGVLSLPIEFFRDNLAGPSQRELLIGTVMGSFVIAGAWGAVSVALDPTRTLKALEWLVRLLCPIIMAPLLLAILQHDFGTEVEEALLLAFFVIVFERLLRFSIDAWADRPREPRPLAPLLPMRAISGIKSVFTGYFARPRLVLATVVLMAIGHGIFMALWAVWSHQRFSTFGYDLGQYDQIFASNMHGKWLAAAAQGWPENWGELNGHADFGTLYMLPIYALHPRASTLLVMQATMLAGAVIPLYLFAKARLPTVIAFSVALAWLLYAPLHGAQLYDVHMQPFGAAWAICAICAVEYRKWVLYWVFFTLAILCREDVSIGLTVMGLFLVISGHRVRTGVATAAVGSLYFLALRFFVMRNHGFAVFFKDLIPPGEPMSFGSVILTLVSNPAFVGKSLVTWEKFRYFAQIFAPLAFLPLRRPVLWILCIPGFILTLLTTAYLPTITISFQYVSNWGAYMLPATAVALSLFPDTIKGRRHMNAAAIALVVASIVSSMQWGAYSTKNTIRGGYQTVPFMPPTEVDKQRERDLQDLMAKVPEAARLCTTDRIQSHTTYHVNNWSLKDSLYDCEYLLWSDIWGDLGNDRGAAALAAGTYELVERRTGLTLAKLKPKPAPVPVPAPAPAVVPAEAPH